MYPESSCSSAAPHTAAIAVQNVPGVPDANQYLNVPEPTPGMFDGPAFRDSIQQFLSENLGEYVVCEFLIGTTLLQTRQGILYSVGTNYLILYEEETATYVICDIYALKFVTFYQPGQRPTAAVRGAAGIPRSARLFPGGAQGVGYQRL